MKVTINAVVYQESGMWVAQCLEFDLVSCADSLGDLPGELMSQIRDQIEFDIEAGREPFDGFPPAPDRFWEMLEQAKAQPEPIKPIKPRKGVLQHLSELADRCRVDAQLFPVSAATT